MPAGIQNGLRHFGLDQFGAAHIAHEDDAIAFRQVRREFMYRILAPVADLGVYRPDALSLVGALRFTQCIFQIAVETPRLQLCAITACRCILQPQIHAYRLAAWGGIRLIFHRHAEIPAPARILHERTGPKLVIC